MFGAATQGPRLDGNAHADSLVPTAGRRIWSETAGALMSPSRLVIVTLALVASAPAAGRTEERDLGRRILVSAGCTGCHDIPGGGVAGADSGPSLEQIGLRAYLAGVLPNTRANLIRWITHPQQFHPGDAMPDTPLSAREADAVADYLQSLR
jgi:cytochrome c